VHSIIFLIAPKAAHAKRQQIFLHLP
jgi:hypothetical protein